MVDQESRSGVVSRNVMKEITVCDGLKVIQELGLKNYSKSAEEKRNCFKNYCSSPEGALAWQVEYVTRSYNQSAIRQITISH